MVSKFILWCDSIIIITLGLQPPVSYAERLVFIFLALINVSVKRRYTMNKMFFGPGRSVPVKNIKVFSIKLVLMGWRFMFLINTERDSTSRLIVNSDFKSNIFIRSGNKSGSVEFWWRTRFYDAWMHKSGAVGVCLRLIPGSYLMIWNKVMDVQMRTERQLDWGNK